jgi:hypothetical protein
MVPRQFLQRNDPHIQDHSFSRQCSVPRNAAHFAKKIDGYEDSYPFARPAEMIGKTIGPTDDVHETDAMFAVLDIEHGSHSLAGYKAQGSHALCDEIIFLSTRKSLHTPPFGLPVQAFGGLHMLSPICSKTGKVSEAKARLCEVVILDGPLQPGAPYDLSII